MSVNKKPIALNKLDQKQTNNLILPDPSYRVAEFLSWLKKRGGYVYLDECKKKWEREGLEIERIVKDLNPHLGLYRSRGKKVVVLENKPWATQWVLYYNLDLPHHRHKIKI